MENFNQLLLDLAAGQNYTNEDIYNTVPSHNDEDYESEIKDDFEFDELLAENAQLKEQLKELEDLSRVAGTQQEYYDYMQNQDMDSPTYAIDLVMADDLFEGLQDNPTSTATWLKKKDNSVNLEGMSSRILTYLESIPESLRDRLLATSGNDSDVHVRGSKHYQGKALDLRFDKDVYDYITNDPNFSKSGLKTVDPNHGTAPHIHIQEYMTGGKYYINPFNL